MIHFLRDKKNNSIVDCEGSANDLHSQIVVEYYSKFLLDLEPQDQESFIEDMDFMQELRGYWWERNRCDRSVPEFETIDSMCKYWFEYMSKKWHLSYVTD